MKPVLLVACLFFSSLCFSQQDTLLAQRVGKLETAVSGVQATVKSVDQKLSATPPVAGAQPSGVAAQPNKPENKEEALRKLSFWQKLYAIMPVGLFCVLFIFLVTWLKRDGFKLSDALKGETPIEIEVPNPNAPVAAAAGVPNAVPQTIKVTKDNPATGEPEMPKSSSRFIALFSGMAAIIIAVCFMSYCVYFRMRNMTPPDFNNMFEAIFALGIGIVPYAVNKFTKSNK